jgi:hypothetical protein
MAFFLKQARFLFTFLANHAIFQQVIQAKTPVVAIHTGKGEGKDGKDERI